MNLSRLPADLEELVERELAVGEYRSEAEPVGDAVRLDGGYLTPTMIISSSA